MAKKQVKGKAAPAPPKRRPGLRTLAATLPGVTKRALGRRGFAEGGLATEWPSIVGAEIAGRCIPKKLSFSRLGRHDDGTLTLRVAPEAATELQHLEPVLIERINGYFGYRAVARLKLQQGPLNLPPAPDPTPPRPLSAEDEAALQDRVAEVEDEELRGALERLGRAVRRRDTA
jgi:hypothetical protein